MSVAVQNSRKARSHVAFARFAAEWRIDPTDLAELLLLAKRAFKAGERECNDPDGFDSEPARSRFEAKAKTLRFDAYWPGLWPALRRTRGRNMISHIHLPEVDI